MQLIVQFANLRMQVNVMIHPIATLDTLLIQNINAKLVQQIALSVQLVINVIFVYLDII